MATPVVMVTNLMSKAADCLLPPPVALNSDWLFAILGVVDLIRSITPVHMPIKLWWLCIHWTPARHTFVLGRFVSAAHVSCSSSGSDGDSVSDARKPEKVGLMGNRRSQRVRRTNAIPTGKS